MIARTAAPAVRAVAGFKVNKWAMNIGKIVAGLAEG